MVSDGRFHPPLAKFLNVYLLINLLLIVFVVLYDKPCIVARGLLLMRAWFIPVLTPIIVFL